MLRLHDGPSLMPPAEGVQHLLRELDAGLPESEILITSREYHGRYYGTKTQPPAAATPDDGPLPNSAVWPPRPASEIASRFTLRAVAAPLAPTSGAAPRLARPAWIFGLNPHALALRDQLLRLDVPAQLVRLDRATDEALAEIEMLYRLQGPGAIFIVPDGCVPSSRESTTSLAAAFTPSSFVHGMHIEPVVSRTSANSTFLVRYATVDTRLTSN